MSTNNINLGNQVLVFDYRQEARGKGFNQAFCDILPYGLYSGGHLKRVSDTVINIGLIVCIIKSDENDKVALRIETLENQDLSLALSAGSPYVDISRPYIVLRFGWHDVDINYMDIRAVGWSTDPTENNPDKLHPLDIILGKVQFQETAPESEEYIIAAGISFDYSRRQDVFLKETESVAGQFRVSTSELDPTKVFISGGKLNTSQGRFLVSGAEFPEDGIPDTENMGRTDLVALDVNGEFKLIQGTPSALFPAPAPKYQNYKVIAEIRRGPHRTTIQGSDILQTADSTILGPISAGDFPLLDSENILPPNAKSIEAAINYLMHHSIAISPEDVATLAVVLRRNIKWGTNDSEGEVYAAAMPVKDADGVFVSDNVEAVLREIAGTGRTTETLTGLADAIESLADYLGTLVYSRYGQIINSISSDRPIFFAKMKKKSTAIFNLKVEGPTLNGSITMAVSVGDTNDLSHSSMSILSTSIPAFFDNSIVYLATHVDSISPDYIFVGFTAVASGLFEISMHAVSSELNGVVGVAYSVPMSTIPYVTFPVSDGYLAGYPVIKPITALEAFRRWSPLYEYQAEDPTFYNGSAYFANPVSVPDVGQSPATHPGKWIQLARPDAGPIDLTEGARTPQLFYQPGLIISNSTALRLRKAHQDQGMQYPSLNSKVYHLDGDLLDQDQQNPLTIIPRSPEFDFNDLINSEFPFNDVEASIFSWNMADLADNVIPHFISENSPPEPPITTDPAIPKKPFKEISEAYFGSFSVPIVMADGNGQNVLDYWFKTAVGGGFNIFSIKLPTGELFDLALGHEEPYWNDNSGMSGHDAFPFNINVALPGTVVYNERSTSAGLNGVQGFGGEATVTPIAIPNNNLPQPNRWNHIALGIENGAFSIFLNGRQQTIPRLSSGFGGTTEITINPQQKPIVLDEILMDWTTSISFARFSEVSMIRLPWAYHEWKDKWLTIFANDPDNFDSNLALYLFPIGSVMTQATRNGNYDPSQTPWGRFHNFKESQFQLQGEVAPTGVGGNGEKTRFWQRIS
jgi:hypothetical protein